MVTKKKATKAKPKVKSAAKTPAGKKLVGTVTHFFDKILVAVVEVKAPIAVGDKLSIEGPKTNFKMSVGSMQVEHKPIKTAKKGDDIGMKVPQPVRVKDLVYKIL